jgi:hypothetical protein
MSHEQHFPEACQYRDLVDRAKVADWPHMTGKSVVAFQKFTGYRLRPGCYLVRKGNRIFEVGDSNLALCVYNNSREF